MNRLKIFLSLILAIGLVIITSLPVFAIADPDTKTIYAIYAYHSIREPDDQLYLVDFKIGYTVLPDEIITEAFIVSFYDSTSTLLKSVVPYTYYNKGYARGIASFYFSNEDAPTWEDTLTITIWGNPTLSWGGASHSVSSSSVNWSTATTQNATILELRAKVLFFANLLQNTWTGYTLVQTLGGANYLSSTGEAYFVNVVPNLRSMCPSLFQNVPQAIDSTKKDFTRAKQIEIDASTTGTALDSSALSTALGIPYTFMASCIFFVILLVICYVASVIVQNQLIILPLAAGGSVMGCVIWPEPFIIPVLVVFFFAIVIWYWIFYKPSYA